MTNVEEAKIKRDNSLCIFLDNNATAFAGDVAFEAIATKTIADYALTVIAASAAAADNTGYSLEKVIAKKAASVMTSELCASSQVILDLLGNIIVATSLNSAVTYYSSATDVLAESRMQNAHDVMSTNIVEITEDYVTVAQLVTLQASITTFKNLSGSNTTVNATFPVKTKALSTAVKLGSADVLNIKKLAKKYEITNPTFYEGLQKVCKIPPITVRHTPVKITVTDVATGLPLPNARGTLSKTKELGVGTDKGIINYTNVLAGLAIATCMLDGYITSVKNVRIKRGKANEFAFVLVAGVITAEMEAAVVAKVNAFIAAENAQKYKKAAKAKAARKAKAAKG